MDETSIRERLNWVTSPVVIEPIFDPPLDEGIKKAVLALNAANIDTYDSCEGGDGHQCREPTIRFHGSRSEGFRALAVAMQAGLKVTSLRRTWPIIEGEMMGPSWEMTFAAAPADVAPTRTGKDVAVRE